MADVFGAKIGSPRSMAELLEPLIEVRFKRVMIDRLNLAWFIALSRDKREFLAVFPNETPKGVPIDPANEIYEVVLYLVRSYREDNITRSLSMESHFRFIRPTQRFEEFADPYLQEYEASQQ